MLRCRLWRGQSMTDSLPLFVFLSWYGFALLAVCLGSLAFSRWFCNVDPNLTLLFYLYDFIYFDKFFTGLNPAPTMTKPSPCFTDRYSISLLNSSIQTDNVSPSNRPVVTDFSVISTTGSVEVKSNKA